MAVHKSSPISFIGNYVICCLLVVFLLLLFDVFSLRFTFFPKSTVEFISSLSVLIAALVLVILLDEPFFERTIRKYVVTDDEIVLEEGLIRKKRVSIPMQNVADVSMEKGILGRILGFGNVIVKGMKSSIKIKGIKNPEKLYENIKNKTSKALKGEE